MENWAKQQLEISENSKRNNTQTVAHQRHEQAANQQERVRKQRQQ